MKYAVTTLPALEPVTLQEAKDHLRVTGTDEDTLISALISAARVKAEEETGRAIVTQTISVFWDTWPTTYPTLFLPIVPALAVSDVRYQDESNVTQTISAADYQVDLYGLTPRIVFDSEYDQPDFATVPNALQVRYVAGADVADVDEATKAAIKLWLGMLYERREDMKINENTPGIRSGAWLLATKRNNLI
jgi:uncharacterized phiE125 gp8 family phage protein